MQMDIEIIPGYICPDFSSRWVKLRFVPKAEKAESTYITYSANSPIHRPEFVLGRICYNRFHTRN